MRNMLRCRRGSVALATVAALVPVIGVIALGAEAGSWYVTKQHAQNAADAAAYSGGLRLACSLGSSTCTDTQTIDYRGKQFAARNAFCNSGDTSYSGSKCSTSLPSGTSQTVTITTPSAKTVQATVTQAQKVYLAALLGFSTVSISATAIAEVQNPKKICALGLSTNGISLTLGGGGTLTGDGCALMSNNTVKYASTPTFSGSDWAIEAVNGCTNSGNCDPGVPYNYNMPLATNPLKGLDTASFNSRTGNTKPLNDATCPTGVTDKCYSVTPNSSGTGAYKDLTVTTGEYVTFAPGTYIFYNAAIKINGGTVTGTDVTLVLLGDSSLSISGGTVTLSAPTTNSYSSLLNGVLIDDQSPNKSSNSVTINGSSAVSLFGAMYFPNVDVTWNGTSANVNTGCTQVIANTITISGTADWSTSKCASNTVAETQVVALIK